MKLKIIIGGIVIIIALYFGVTSFIESSVEYLDFTKAKMVKKKVQVKGMWQKEKEYFFDFHKNEFSFYMRDDSGVVQKVIYRGGKPNNFEIVDAIVVKGRYENDIFYASEILTKCPSKYNVKSVNVK